MRYGSDGVDILIVEDSPTQAAVLRETLKQYGFHVSVTHSAEKALVAIQEHRPTMVISDIFFAGKTHFITASRMQIVSLLFSTFDNAIRKNAELEQANRRLQLEIIERKRVEVERKKLIAELEEAITQIKTLRGMLPVCASCKKVRDDQGYWHQVEVYIRDHSEAEISHGICPECARKLYPEYYQDESHSRDRE